MAMNRLMWVLDQTRVLWKSSKCLSLLGLSGSCPQGLENPVNLLVAASGIRMRTGPQGACPNIMQPSGLQLELFVLLMFIRFKF